MEVLNDEAVKEDLIQEAMVYPQHDRVHDAGAIPDVLMDPSAVGAPAVDPTCDTPAVPYIDPGGQRLQAFVPYVDPGGGRPQVIGALSVPYIDPRGQRPHVVGSQAVVPYINPGGQPRSYGAAGSLQDRHGAGGTKHDPLLLSDPRDLLSDQDQAPDVVMEPGGLNPNSKYLHRSYGGRSGGQFKNNRVQPRGCIQTCGPRKGRGHFRECISYPRRYRSNRGRFRSFNKKLVNTKKLPEARDLHAFNCLVMGPVSPITETGQRTFVLPYLNEERR